MLQPIDSVRFGLVTLLFWCVSLATPALGANLTLANTENCTITLSGAIESGDAERFKELFKAYKEGSVAQSSYRWPTLCLNSPGGNLAEAIKIADTLLQKYQSSTVLQENAQCLSACALIFMMGTSQPPDEETLLSRNMHYTATLGFHRPELEVNLSEWVNKARVQESFDVALNAALDFIRLSAASSGDRHGGLIDADLLERLFSIRGEKNHFYISTTGRAGRWDIDVFGYEAPNRIDQVAVQYACDNLTTWPFYFNEERATTWEDPAIMANLLQVYRLEQRELLIAPGRHKAIGSAGDGLYIHECEISYGDSGFPFGTNGVLICGSNGYTGWSNACDPGRKGLTGTLSDTFVAQLIAYTRLGPILGIFDPRTKLEELNNASREIERRAEIELASYSIQTENQLWTQCNLTDHGLTVVNVNSFVNMREGTSFKHRIVAVAPLGTELQFAGEIRVINSEPKMRCLALCNGAHKQTLSATEKQALKVCFEENAVWYHVRMSNNRDGWISGKFLDLAK